MPKRMENVHVAIVNIDLVGNRVWYSEMKARGTIILCHMLKMIEIRLKLKKIKRHS